MFSVESCITGREGRGGGGGERGGEGGVTGFKHYDLSPLYSRLSESVKGALLVTPIFATLRQRERENFLRTKSVIPYFGSLNTLYFTSIVHICMLHSLPKPLVC